MERLNLTKLRRVRRKKQLSLKQVADRLDMQYSIIWKYENGHPKFPEHITMIWNLLKLPDSPAMAERQAPCITVPASSGLLPV